MPNLVIEGCHLGADLDLSPIPLVILSFLNISLLSLIYLDPVEINFELHDVIMFGASEGPHVALHVFQLSMIMEAQSFNKVGALAQGWELGGISRIALNVIGPIRVMLVKAPNLKVAVFGVFEVDKTLIGSVNELLPHICVHKVVDVIVRGCLNHCLILLKFEAIHGEVLVILISPHPDGVCD